MISPQFDAIPLGYPVISNDRFITTDPFLMEDKPFLPYLKYRVAFTVITSKFTGCVIHCYYIYVTIETVLHHVRNSFLYKIQVVARSLCP